MEAYMLEEIIEGKDMYKDDETKDILEQWIGDFNFILDRLVKSLGQMDYR